MKVAYIWWRMAASRTVRLSKPGVVRVYCNIHPQMVAFVVVVDGDLHAKTGVDGVATIAWDLPGRSMNVLDEEWRPVEPGSGKQGMLARRGHIPLGYWKDEEKTAATFVTDPDGVRWVIPGDHAVIEADGTITMLGRGSVCINSGGEKIFPEEVEAVLKAHPAVFDAVVIGVPDERFVERVAAVVKVRDGFEAPSPATGKITKSAGNTLSARPASQPRRSSNLPRSSIRRSKRVDGATLVEVAKRRERERSTERHSFRQPRPRPARVARSASKS